MHEMLVSPVMAFREQLKRTRKEGHDVDPKLSQAGLHHTCASSEVTPKQLANKEGLWKEGASRAAALASPFATSILDRVSFLATHLRTLAFLRLWDSKPLHFSSTSCFQSCRRLQAVARDHLLVDGYRRRECATTAIVLLISILCAEVEVMRLWDSWFTHSCQRNVRAIRSSHCQR